MSGVRGQVGVLDLTDGAAEVFLYLFQIGIDVCVRPLGHHFNSAVREVAYIPCDLIPTGHTMHGITKPNTLHTTDKDPPFSSVIHFWPESLNCC